MSSPADIETADASWLVEDESPAIPIAIATKVETKAAKSPDKIIHAPSRHNAPSRAAISTTTGNSGANKTRATVSNTNTNINTNSNGNGNATSAAETASQKTWGQYFREGFQRDGLLLLITIGILICMNIPYIRYVLYPFDVYSTWIHEMCHGLAAIAIGGSIQKLEIFPDTSGMATSGIPNGGDRRSFVSSAGYQGTAFTGFILLIFRRTKRGPRTGTMALACTMILSCVLWVRNLFGFCFLFGMGLVLAGLAYKIPSTYIRGLYVILAVTCSMNAITSVHDLFGINAYVNGQPSSTDAHTMAEIVGGSYLTWAILWLTLAIVLTILGIVFAIPGPDEVADFACCGVCQDCGLFTPCNYPGQRLVERFRNRNSGTVNETAPGGGGSATATNTEGP